MNDSVTLASRQPFSQLRKSVSSGKRNHAVVFAVTTRFGNMFRVEYFRGTSVEK